jgi:hypothetical protein
LEKKIEKKIGKGFGGKKEGRKNCYSIFSNVNITFNMQTVKR